MHWFLGLIDFCDCEIKERLTIMIQQQLRLTRNCRQKETPKKFYATPLRIATHSLKNTAQNYYRDYVM